MIDLAQSGFCEGVLIKRFLIGKRSAEIEAQRIEVSILEDDKVSLKGHIHDWKERNAVWWAAWSALRVSRVEDHLTVG